MIPGHGGDIKSVVEKYKIPQDRIIDFSSNINPLGVAPQIKDAIVKSINLIEGYPDPECRDARETLANHLGVQKDNLLFGNGSNELIHLVPRAMGCSRALICLPAFSEYESSVRLAGAKPCFLLAKERDNFYLDITKMTRYIPKVDIVFLCNPNNPTGVLLEKGHILNLAELCDRHKTYLFIDEVFMEFVDDEEKFSLIKEAARQRYLLVLRSVTKFFNLAGLRLGYLVANKEVIRKASLFQPTWSVNSIAQNIVAYLMDAQFISQTKEFIRKERELLFTGLKKIRGLYPYKPAANFILCRLVDKKMDSKAVFVCLAKSGFIIRDCSNFKGLGRSFIRLAVRKKEENIYLLRSLRKIFR